jgi:hypothetical protein
MTFVALVIVVALGAGCRDKRASAPIRDDAAGAASTTEDAEGTQIVDAGVWPELAVLPAIEPERVIALPTRAGVPRFTIGGPVLLGDLAVVSSSQFGFVAVDFRRGQLAWSKPAGSHVAPPIVIDGKLVLISACLTPPQIPDDEQLLGCIRVVTKEGADEAYLAIRGKQATGFARSMGVSRIWKSGPDRVTWRRDDAAVTIDLLTGVARPAPADDPPLVVRHAERTWEIRRTDDGIITATGKPSWQTEGSYGPLLGAVYIPEQSPMVRVASTIMHEGKPELLLFDIDATGSLHGQVSMSPVPGIGVIGHGISTVGDVAIAVRLDTSLRRDYIAGYAANALLMWTYALPDVPRPDPVGIAIAHDAVVVFHDGDTLTVLPELSAPPTAPGAVRAPSENATP